MKKIYTVKKFASRKFYTAFLLALSISALTFQPVFAEEVVSDAEVEEETEEIADQMLVISKTDWNNREINLLGRGSRNLLLYGSTRAGALNNLTLNGFQTPIYIYGGYYDGSLETGEIVDVTGNKINVSEYGNGWIFFEEGHFDDAYNRLHIYDVADTDLRINVIGARSGYGLASGNMINIYGGKLNGYVIGGENKDTAANPLQNIFDNTINVYNSPNLREIKLYGAAVFSDDTRERTPIFGTNNTLNFYTKNIDVTELNGFNNYNFYLPDTITHRDVVLNVIGDKVTDISGSKVFAVVPQVSTIDPHEKITLIRNNTGIEDSNATQYDGINGFDGTRQWQANPTSIYDIHVNKFDENNVVVEFIGRETTPPTNLIPIIRVPYGIDGGGDFVSNFGGEGSFGGGGYSGGRTSGGGTFGGENPSGGGGSWDGEPSSGGGTFDGDKPSDGDGWHIGRTNDTEAGAQLYTPFLSMSHASMRHKTNGRLETRSTHLIAGFSRKFETEKRRTLFAPMIEYGRGSYDTYLSTGEHGQGHSQYLGGGVVFHTQLSNGVFYNGSIRAGRSKTDFESADFGYNGYNVYERFETNSPYISAHFGIGRELKQNKNLTLTYYGKFLFSHTFSDNIHLTSGEDYYLSSVNSARIRLGIRAGWEVSPKNKFYTGLGYQYQFGGKSYAEHDGIRTDTASIRGSSGIVELGWIAKPYGNDTLSLDLGAMFSFGKSRGVMGRCGVNWFF